MATATVLAKPFWLSRTLILNAIGLVALIIGVVIDNAALVDLPPAALGYLGMALAIANAILRFSTTAPLASGRGQTAEVPAPATMGGQVEPRG